MLLEHCTLLRQAPRLRLPLPWLLRMPRPWPAATRKPQAVAFSSRRCRGSAGIVPCTQPLLAVCASVTHLHAAAAA